jgi:hypothetical protein
MRIYTVSSHCVGKTTICKYISEKYNLPMITEVARQVLSEHEWSIDSLRFDLQKVNQYQKEVFYRQLEEEKKYEGRSFVSDRGFDFLCYTIQHATISPEILVSNEWKNYIESLKKDDVLILFVRPHKSLIKSDGVRESINWEGMIAIDAMTKMLLQMFGLKYFQIDCVSMQERTNLVDNIIDLFLAKEEKKKTVIRYPEKETIKINGVDLGITQEEYHQMRKQMIDEYQEQQKLQTELRNKEKLGFVKFGGKNEVVYYGDNPNDDEIKQINIPATKYKSVYSSQAILGQKMNYSSFLGGEEIIAEDERQELKPLGICISEPNRGTVMVELPNGIFGPNPMIPKNDQKYKGEF